MTIRNDYENYYKPEEQAIIRNHNIDWAIWEFAKNHQKILDAGAGAGVLAKKLAERGKDVTCLDINTANVEFMRQNGLKAVLGDIRKGLPFKDKEFDLAICQEVLEHIENPGTGLSELCRVAKHVIFSLPKNYEDDWHLWNIDYIPYITDARCIVIKMSQKEEECQKIIQPE